MPTTMTLLQMRTMIRQRADMANASGVYTNAFVTDPELNTYIQQSLYELYDLLIEAFEEYYLAPPLKITTDGTTRLYPLPDGTLYSGAPALYKLAGVDLGLDASGNAMVTLSKFNFIDRNRYVFPQLNAQALGPFNMQYRMMGSSLMMMPIPSAGQILQLWYYPRLVVPTADTDTFDGISGWTEYPIVDCVIKLKEKEEGDVSVELAQKEALKKRIESASQSRDSGQPDRISDTRGAAGRFGRRGGQGDYGGFGVF